MLLAGSDGLTEIIWRCCDFNDWRKIFERVEGHFRLYDGLDHEILIHQKDCLAVCRGARYRCCTDCASGTRLVLDVEFRAKLFRQPLLTMAGITMHST